MYIHIACLGEMIFYLITNLWKRGIVEKPCYFGTHASKQLNGSGASIINDICVECKATTFAKVTFILCGR